MDAQHPDIASALKTNQIVAFKGFPESLDPLRDQYGHGTHGTSVLIMTAPKAILYVARVADDEGDIRKENDYLNTVNVSFRSCRDVG